MRKILKIKYVIALVLAFWIGIFLYNYYRKWKEDSFDREILAAAANHNINPALIKAVIWRESKFNPNAIGKRGEIGLMQIMPATANEWAAAKKLRTFIITDLFSPSNNIDCGTWYLKKSLSRYQMTDNPLPYGLADYNAGRANVLKWMKGEAATNSVEFINQITFSSTKNYVISILERFRYYNENWLPTVTSSKTE
jgi:soluble lytic murein transglycosylase